MVDERAAGGGVDGVGERQASVLATIFIARLATPEAFGSSLRYELVDPDRLGAREVVSRVVRGAGGHDVVALNGSGRVDQLAATLVNLRRRPPPIVLVDCTWARGTSALDRAANLAGVRLIDRGDVTYCVLSSHELESFPRTWGVDPSRMAFTPYHHTLTPDELALPLAAGRGVFAGGDSMRDHQTLLVAARSLREPVVLATTLPGIADRADLPGNVTAGGVSFDRFRELMRESAVVVVGMTPGIERSAGQQTYLNAMAWGKAVVVTDSPGARDHVEDRVTGLVVPPGDPDALASAIAHCLDPANAEQVGRMRRAGHDVARAVFTPDNFVRSVLRVVDGVAARGQAVRASS